jgi:hypothetical protein
MLTLGGNQALHEFFEKYQIAFDCPILFKYNTKAAKYYRDKLLAEATSRQIEQPDFNIDEGAKLREAEEDLPEPSVMDKLKSFAHLKLEMSMEVGRKTIESVD